MRRIFGLRLALAGALVLAAGNSAAEASTKFAYTEEVDPDGECHRPLRGGKPEAVRRPRLPVRSNRGCDVGQPLWCPPAH